MSRFAVDPVQCLTICDSYVHVLLCVLYASNVHNLALGCLLQSLFGSVLSLLCSHTRGYDENLHSLLPWL